jgi:glucosylceramidase
MSNNKTRRDFLKISGLGMTSVLAAGKAVPIAIAAPPVNHSEAAVWVTDESRRLKSAPSIMWQPASGQPSPDAIVVDAEKKFQPVLGFGAAFTDAACYTFKRLDPAARAELFHDLFHPSQMGLSVCRTCIGASDYSTSLYSFDEGDPDPELTRFSIEHDRAYILPILREARKTNPDLFLFSSPWSPPGWMKPNGSMLGGSMRRKYMPAYANYFVKFLQGYQSEGVPVQAVTVQNEVDTEQDGRMPACAWPMEYEADFVRQFLGPAFEKNGIGSKIWIIDHNYNLWGRAMGELETPDLRKYVNAIAWHGYVGKPEWMMRVQNAYPEIEMYWTEGGPDYTDPHYSDDWANWGNTFSEILRNGCRSITAWNFALDEKGKPNIGPFNCGGLVTVHSQTKEITRSGQYWAFAHYSRFVQRGARRIESQGIERLGHAGFQNPDGSHVLVMANPGPDSAVEIRSGQATARIELTQNSLTTLKWSGPT